MIQFTQLYTSEKYARFTSILPKTFKLSLLATGLALTFACAGPASEEEQHAQKEQEKQTQQSKAEEKRKTPEVELLYTEELTSERIEVTGSRLVRADMSIAHSPANYESFHPEQDLVFHGPQQNTENYQNIDENTVKAVSTDPVSTFSIDVDTGSYTNSRRMLTQGYLPPKDAIRVEEFINYFDYQYQGPESAENGFSVDTQIATAPWNEQRHLLRIALKGYSPEVDPEAGRNLVFLLDVSGSMNQENKLPLLKRSLSMLTQQLNKNDRVSIVVYAGASGVVLEPTPGNERNQIIAALDKLQAGGSTNGASGIQLAYQMAEEGFVKKGVNRVILATDGDFNVGMVDQDTLIDLIEEKREKGIALTTLGFGQGNYNDYLMEQLADAGNGNYAYIDTINEARKVLVDELQSTMQIIAKDVKIQVEFNPNQVAEYRLIGYENRKLNNEDFNNDKVDAGDIGAGHRVTALYEISLVDSKGKFNDELRYANNKDSSNDLSDELAFVKLRFKVPNADKSQLVQNIVKREQIKDFQAQTDDFKFATAVAGFAQLMRKSKYTDGIDYQWVADTANASKGQDEFGYRSEFVQLVRNAEALTAQHRNMNKEDDVETAQR